MSKNALFASNLKRLRDLKNWSQLELAHEAEVGHQTVWRAEQGIVPRGQNIAKIAGALGVTEAQLFAEPDPVQLDEMSAAADLTKSLSVEIDRIKGELAGIKLNARETEELRALRERVALLDRLIAMYGQSGFDALLRATPRKVEIVKGQLGVFPPPQNTSSEVQPDRQSASPKEKQEHPAVPAARKKAAHSK